MRVLPSDAERLLSTTSPIGRTITVVLLAAAFLLIGCQDTSSVTGLERGLSTDESLRYALALSPGNHTAAAGEYVQYLATLVDASGATRGPAIVTWSVGDAAVASISAAGMLRALRSGTTTVTARQGGRARSVPITVTGGSGAPTAPTAPSGSEPVFVAGTHTSLWHDNVESTASSADIYSRYTTMGGESGFHLDATGGVNGSRAIRVDWRAKSDCADDSHLLEGSFPASQEVVVQYSVRYQPGFVFDWIGRGGPCSGNAKKLFFLWAQTGSRFDFISENNALGAGSDVDHPLFAQNLGNAIAPDGLGDGNWHRITLRIRQSSTPTAPDGYIHGWVDGVQRWSVNNIPSNASGGWVLFKLPTTMNQGSPVNQSEWMDDFRIWRP